MRKSTILISIIVFAFVISAENWPKPPSYHDIRSMGMGNVSVATATDRTALFHNPAGLGLLKDDAQISTRPLVLSFNGDFQRYLDFLTKYNNKLGNMSDLASAEVIEALGPLDGQWIGFDYLPEVSFAKKNLGFGVYSVFPFGLAVETGQMIPKLMFKGQQDLVFTWGVGIPLADTNIQFGVSMAYIQRVPVERHITTFTETQTLADEAAKNPFAPVLNLNNRQHGASFDIGFMQTLPYGFRLGYSAKSIFGVLDGHLMIPEVNLGGSYYFPMLEQHSWIRSTVASLEFKNLIGFEEQSHRYEHFAKKIHMGAEIDLKWIALRGGISQGYPTGGVTLAAGPVTLDYVYFTEESGFYPGQDPKTMHMVSLGLAIFIESKKIHYAKNPDDTPPVDSTTPPQENAPESAAPASTPASPAPATSPAVTPATQPAPAPAPAGGAW